jgi:WD40 repeat protein
MLSRHLLGLALISVCAMRLPAAQPKSVMRAVSRVERPSISLATRSPVVSAIAISPDGDLLATAGDDHCVRLWDAQDGRLLHVLRGHRDWVRTVAFTPDGGLLVSAGDDRVPHVWQTRDGRLVGQLTPATAAIYSLTISPDGKSVATAGFSRQIEIHNLASSEVSKVVRTDCHELRCLVYSPDGRQLLAGGRPGKLVICDVERGQVIASHPTSLRRIRAVAWSSGGSRIAVAGDGMAIEIWSTANWQCHRQWASPSGSIRAITFCAEDIVAAGGTDNRIRIWNTDVEGKPRSLNGHLGSINALAFDLASGRLVSGGYDTRIRVWNIDSSIDQVRNPMGQLH